jgi:hypothetical protein
MLIKMSPKARNTMPKATKKADLNDRLLSWCYAVDVILTKSIELVDDYALRELVQEFSLSPDLVTA